MILKEFSSFRTPLGTEVVKVITPPNFFLPKAMREHNEFWPENMIDLKFKDDILL